MIEKTNANDQAASRRTTIGKVVSCKMNKTIIIEVTRQEKHPKYNKYINRRSKLQAHDETNQCKEGDTVRIEECRPLSRNKSWRLVEVIN